MRTGTAELVPPLTGLAALLDQVVDAKRIRAAGRDGSLAQQRFRLAWTQLVAGVGAERVARRETAAAVAAIRLGALDVPTMIRLGLAPGTVLATLRAAVAAVADPLTPAQRSWLDDGLGELVAERPAAADLPPFVDALCDQPRCAPVSPDGRRLPVGLPETHADHCWAVAVGAALFSEPFGARPGEVFLVGLSHHLHHALLPDVGPAGAEVFGDQLSVIAAGCRDEVLRQLPLPLRDDVEHALLAVRDASTPTGRAHHAADALDRRLQLLHDERAAAFTAASAEGRGDEVSSVGAFRGAVLTAAGLR